MFLNEDNFINDGRAESLVIDSSNKSISFFSINKLKTKENFIDENRLSESNDDFDSLLDEVFDDECELKEYCSQEQLTENSLFFNSSNDYESLEEGFIAKGLKFLMRPIHLTNDINENQRQFKKVYSQIAATKNLDDETFCKNVSRILRFTLDCIVKGLGIGLVSVATSFIPIVNELATTWVTNKLYGKLSINALRNNLKVLYSAKEEIERKIETEDDYEVKKAYKDTLNAINKSISTCESKKILFEKEYTKSKREDFDFEDDYKEDELLEEDFFNDNIINKII